MNKLNFISEKVKKIGTFFKKQQPEVVLQKENEEMLDLYLGNLFPDYQTTYKTLTATQEGDKDVANVYDQKYLIYRTRDNKWLANFVQKHFYKEQKLDILNKLKEGQTPTSLRTIPVEEVEVYVAKSDKFRAKRNGYEFDVARGYAHLKLSEEKWDVFSDPAFFRNKVISNLHHMGIDLNNAKIAMEIYRDEWLGAFIEKSFTEDFKKYDNVLSSEERNFLQGNHPVASTRLDLIKADAEESYAQHATYSFFTMDNDARDVFNQVLKTPDKLTMIKNFDNIHLKNYRRLCNCYFSESRKCIKLMYPSLEEESVFAQE